MWNLTENNILVILNVNFNEDIQLVIKRLLKSGISVKEIVQRIKFIYYLNNS
jgi:hypothetical protein